jgi:hypothetical protein
MGEETWVKAHYWGPKIVVTWYCLQEFYVWTSTMSLLWIIFTMFLHIMVGQNPKKSNAKETTFYYFIWCDVSIYLCQKKKHYNILKMQIYSKKDWNDFKF